MANKMKLQFHSLGTRIFLIFAASFFGILAILSYVYYESTSARVKDMLSDAAVKNVDQASEHVDLLFKGYESLSKSIVTNPDIQRLVGRNNDNPAVRAINERTITNALGAIYYAWDDIIGIHVMSKDGAVYSYGSLTQVIDESFSRRDWYEKLQQSEGETIWFGMERLSLIEKNGKGQVFAFGRKLYNLTRSESVGVVLIEMKPHLLQSILNNANITEQTESYLVEEDVIKVHLDNKMFQQKAALLSNALSFENGGFEAAGDRVIIHPQRINDWKMVSVTKLSSLKMEMNALQKYFTWFTLGLLVLSLILALFVSIHVTAPFKQMRLYMKKATIGKFEEIPKGKSYAELESLTLAYNRMVRQLDELFVRMQEVSESERLAQLNALQSQVNPHFLYNTLDMIYWMLDEQGNEKLGDVILALSGIFRYSSNWDHGSDVTLREELEQIRGYALITQMRFGDKLTFEWNVEDRLLALPIPKMTLQPIIENAVLHGVGESGGRIRFSMAIKQGQAQLAIEDDGAGMSAGRVERLNAIFGEEDSRAVAGLRETSGIGIGLVNVHNRIKYRFGSEFGLAAASEGAGCGTMIKVTVPIGAMNGNLSKQEGK